MIASLKGLLIHQDLDYVIVEVNGLGYKVFVAKPENFKLNDSVFLYTHHNIREDGQELYGFLDIDSLRLFERLISVKGVGCKTANTIFTKSKNEDLIHAIETANIDYLRSMPGIGAKTAQQIILDLKGKLVETDNNKVETNDHLQELFSALKQLGYKSSEIAFLNKALKEFEMLSIDQLLKKALVLLNQRKGN
jgi:holliday junction DNA helicase RuvA